MLITITFAVALLLSLLLASKHTPLKILDAPNERSLHETPTPRTGGVAIMLAVFLAWSIQAWEYGLPEEMRWIVAAALLVAGISFADDLHELSPVARILIHGLAAVLLLAGGFLMFEGWVGAIFTWFAIVWMLNLFNFMDGMDGFAGGMTLSGFAFLACAGWLQGAVEYALFSALVAAAGFGFLWVNFPPAKLFMGDTGSATIGFLAAAFSLWGMKEGIFDLWLPLLVFSPFVLDATITLLRRVMRREKVWQAHREHYYQRLALAGWGHKKTVLVEYLLMLAVGTSAIAMLYWEEAVVAGLVFWAIVYGSLAYKADRFCRR